MNIDLMIILIIRKFHLNYPQILNIHYTYLLTFHNIDNILILRKF